ncbi:MULTISPECIES: hypothetical protein [Micromonospora]|uniref:Uncharacterized protein n=1 Tax=Micromonospora yangpuensis TaxID=683228 RepID=A0A1C6U2F5_9ACTN|nr:hypothetical protein [Micromonospora yangpuensis]GGM10519.1 hypothetical protein GCM10012279_30700 [Micromonospora yangpuensis]SCL48091.1 hypothetical protein GA0070617_0773 [Micromonospora yangpuensis]
MRPTSRALIAGAAGASALNAVTYLDMAVRARPASSAAEDSVARLADLAHVDLGDRQTGGNRRAGLGPLLGYVTSVAAAGGYVAAGGRRLPTAVSALALTGLAMIASNGPLTALRVTDPRSWSATDWATDLVPHLAYGVVTAVALRALR